MTLNGSGKELALSCGNVTIKDPSTTYAELLNKLYTIAKNFPRMEQIIPGFNEVPQIERILFGFKGGDQVIGCSLSEILKIMADHPRETVVYTLNEFGWSFWPNLDRILFTQHV